MTRIFFLAVIYIYTTLMSLSFALESEEIELFDVRSYSPVKYGLKDLVLTIRSPELEENLNKQKVYGKISDLHFKIHWIYPGEMRLEVLGMPKGFIEVKNNLKKLIQDKWDYFIPGKLSTKLRAYKLTLNKKAKNYIEYQAVDPTQKLFVGQMFLKFKENGELLSIKSLTPVGSVDSSFSFGPTSWSHNKWVLSELKVKSVAGMQLSEGITKIKYETTGGVGLPKEIQVNSIQQTLVPNNSKKKNTYKTNITYIVSDVKVNTGAAMKYIKNETRMK